MKRLLISGMTCAGCVTKVEKALRRVPGVSSASVNLVERLATVSGPSGRGEVRVEVLIQAVQAIGYQAQEFLEEASQDHSYFKTLYLKAGVAGCLGLPLFWGDLFHLLPSLDEAQAFWIGGGILTLGILIYSGGHFFTRAWKALLIKTATMETLIAVGTGTAWIYSMGLSLFPALLPEIARHVYFEAAVIIIAFINLGSALEAKARGKTSQAIQKLLGL